MKVYKVLFFVAGMVPTELQRREALNFGPHVTFRNANMIGEDDNCEDCVAVYGDAVPPQYAAKFPWACSIVDYYLGKLDPVVMATPEAAEAAPASGAGDPETFDPFATTDVASRAGVDWTPQG